MRNIYKAFILGLLGVTLIGCNTKEKKEVTLYMWGGDAKVNSYVQDIAGNYIKEKEGIDLKSVPVVDIKDVVNKLIVEKQAGKDKGSVDILWINGENFNELKKADLLEKGILAKMENRKSVKESATLKDFGVDIDGDEVPWGEAQFNFIYDGNRGDVPFDGWESLREYVKENPDRFTYPAVSDFTGSAFVRNIVIDMLGYENIMKMSDEEFKANLQVVWDYLNEIKPYLWRKGETYPESVGKLDLLYSTGEIEVTMGYTVNKVNSKIEAGDFSKTSKSFLLKRGTLFNNHYLAIAKSSQNKEEALKVIDAMISAQLQYEKQLPKNWGDFTILDIEKLSEKDREGFVKLIENPNVPSLKELQEKRVLELSPAKLLIIEREWKEKVGKN